MLDITDYILLPIKQRKSHIDLSVPCVERGGPQGGGLSYLLKGLMAHIFDTTIPKGYKINVCHACNNPNCSNPAHLYWGTVKENVADRIGSGEPSVWDRTVSKYGLDEAHNLAKTRSKAGSSAGGKANAGKAKSDAHKLNIALSTTGKKRGPYKKRAVL